VRSLFDVCADLLYAAVEFVGEVFDTAMDVFGEDEE
jgi:hypothetical protein